MKKDLSAKNDVENVFVESAYTAAEISRAVAIEVKLGLADSRSTFPFMGVPVGLSPKASKSIV